LACPYFVPIEKWDAGTWLHPSRLPLGTGWLGCCGAPGHEGEQPTEQEVSQFCNLGYAANCGRMPKEKKHDAVRFSVAKESGPQLSLWFVCEAAHLPVEHGRLEYNSALRQWISAHSNPLIQKMAECYVQTYLARKVGFAGADSSTSVSA
jgi:hypothetical protein